MFRGRASNLARRSISTLYQISSPSSSSHPHSSIRRKFSTVAQRSDFQPDPHDRDPQSAYGCHGGNAGEAHHQNPNGFYRENSFQQRADGFYGEGSREFPLNPSANGRRISGEFYQTPNTQYMGNIGDVRQHNPNGFYRENPQQRAYEIYGERSGEIHPDSHRNDRRYAEEFYYSSNGYNRGTTGEFCQQNSDEFYRENPRQLADGLHREIPSEIHLNPNGNNIQGFHGEKASGVHQRPNRLHVDKPVEFQQMTLWQSSSSINGVTKESLAVESSKADESGSYKATVDELDYFCREGKVKEAVEVLALLEKNSVVVDRPRYLHLLQLCGEAHSLEEARIVHNYILRAMVGLDVGLYNKILDMYSKCGSMSDAYQLFEKMPQRNLTSWDTMIMGLAKNGLGEEAIDLFTQFKQTGLFLDGQIFITIFFVCGVLGAVDEGMLHFESMQKDFGIAPRMEHYVSIVDMLGRTGYLDEALEFVERMPFEPSVDVWETLMHLCRTNGNLELGGRCAEIVEHLDSSRLTEQAKMGLLPINASDVEKVKVRRKSNLLGVGSKVHNYMSGDRFHPEHVKIHEYMRGLVPQMKEAGYVPDTRFVLHDVDQEAREEALLYHSERLAVSHALMASSARTPLRILKNLRVCGDCHNALKIISKLVGRSIIARDAKRWHHFENGVCSCKEYW